VNTNAVSKAQLKQLAPPEQRTKIDQALAQPGIGAALYVDSAGNKLVLGYGTFRAELPSRFCPASVGDMTLRAYTPPAAVGGPEEMVSPLLIGVRQQQETPQFPTKWANAPSQTEHPGDRIGVAAVMMPLGLEPEPTQRFVIQEERESAPAPPPPPPEEPKRLKSWWSRFDVPR
jgi:hypothetical protein